MEYKRLKNNPKFNVLCDTFEVALEESLSKILKPLKVFLKKYFLKFHKLQI